MGVKMIRRAAFVALSIGIAALSAASTFGATTDGARAFRSLRIVYAGVPGSRHMQSYKALLSRYFRSVRTIAVVDLPNADLSNADVLVVDGSYKDQAPRGVTLETLSIPTVLIGGMGGKISDSLDLKLGW